MGAASWFQVGWIVVAAIVVLCAFIVPIRVGFFYGRHEAHDDLRVSIGVVRPLRVEFRLPVARIIHVALNRRRKRKEKRKPKNEREGPGFRINAPIRLVALAFRRIERFEWRTQFGTGDAALTSWIAGALWSFKASLVSVLSRRHAFIAAPQVSVVPDFDNAHLALDLCCIFRFTIGEIILAALSMLFHKNVPLRYKGGD